MKNIVKAILANTALIAFSCLADSDYQCTESEEFNAISFENSVLSVDKLHFSLAEKSPDKRRSGDDRRSQYEDIYRKCYLNTRNGKSIKNLSDQHLHILYSSLEIIFFYTQSRTVLNDLRKTIFEKERRGDNIDKLIVNLHSGYIDAREFEKAENLETQYPNLTFKKVPPVDISKINKNNLLAISKDNKSLVAEPFTFPKGGHVIVIGSPQCNPSNRFFSWLIDSPEFLSVLKSHATFISPVGRGLNVEVVSDFNRSNPVELKFTYREKEWPEIRSWATPSFHFYKNGELVTFFKGWPPENSEELLRDELESVGLSVD